MVKKKPTTPTGRPWPVRAGDWSIWAGELQSALPDIIPAISKYNPMGLALRPNPEGTGLTLTAIDPGTLLLERVLPTAQRGQPFEGLLLPPEGTSRWIAPREPDETVHIQREEGNHVTLRCNSRTLKCASFPIEEAPSVLLNLEKATGPVPLGRLSSNLAQNLIEGLRQIGATEAQDVILAQEGERAIGAITDSVRLYIIEDPESHVEQTLSLRTEDLLRCQKILALPGTLQAWCEEDSPRYLEWTAPGWGRIGLIPSSQGRFDWRSIWTRAAMTKGLVAAEIDRKALLHEIKEVLPFAQKNRIRISMTPKDIRLQAGGPNESYGEVESAPVPWQSNLLEPTTYTFNGKFLADALNTFEEDTITLKLCGSGHPALISGHRRGLRVNCLLMPIQS